MKSSILKTIEIEETQDEDNKTGNTDRNQTDHVRQIHRHEKATLTAGQGVPINDKSGRPDLTLPECTIVSVSSEHRVGTTTSSREGMETDS